MKAIVADILIVRKRLLEWAAIHANRPLIPKSGLCYSTHRLAETTDLSRNCVRCNGARKPIPYPPPPVEPTHQHVFDLDEFLRAVTGALAAETGFLHTAERGELGRDG